MTFTEEFLGALLFPTVILTMIAVVNVYQKVRSVRKSEAELLPSKKETLKQLLGREGILDDFCFDSSMNLIITASGERYRFETNDNDVPVWIIDPTTGKKLDKRARKNGIDEMTRYFSERLSEDPTKVVRIEQMSRKSGRAVFNTSMFNDNKPLNNMELIGLRNAFNKEGFKVLSASQRGGTMTVTKKEVFA